MAYQAVQTTLVFRVSDVGDLTTATSSLGTQNAEGGISRPAVPNSGEHSRHTSSSSIGINQSAVHIVQCGEHYWPAVLLLWCANFLR
jgi:hypothetical protein